MNRIVILLILFSLATYITSGQEVICCDSIPVSIMQKFRAQYPYDKITRCNIQRPGSIYGIFHSMDSNVSLFTFIEEKVIRTNQNIELKNIPFDVYRKIKNDYIDVENNDSNLTLFEVTASYTIVDINTNYYEICKHFGCSIKSNEFCDFTFCKYFDLEGNECKRY
jgi:hypothetical protein